MCNQSGSGFNPCDCTVDGGHDGTLSSDAAGDTTAMDVSVDAGSDVRSPSDAGQDVTDAFVPNDGPALVTGAIQKGPFVLGSTVTLSAIDTSGIPT